MKKLFKLLENTAILSCTFFMLFDNTEWSYFNNDLNKVTPYFPYKSDYAIMEIKELGSWVISRIEIKLTKAGQLKCKILKYAKSNQDFITEFGNNLIKINKEIEKINNS